jgi:hypothetical protein
LESKVVKGTKADKILKEIQTISSFVEENKIFWIDVIRTIKEELFL